MLYRLFPFLVEDLELFLLKYLLTCLKYVIVISLTMQFFVNVKKKKNQVKLSLNIIACCLRKLMCFYLFIKLKLMLWTIQN
jgi:hypothetical protein